MLILQPLCLCLMCLLQNFPCLQDTSNWFGILILRTTVIQGTLYSSHIILRQLCSTNENWCDWTLHICSRSLFTYIVIKWVGVGNPDATLPIHNRSFNYATSAMKFCFSFPHTSPLAISGFSFHAETNSILVGSIQPCYSYELMLHYKYCTGINIHHCPDINFNSLMTPQLLIPEWCWLHNKYTWVNEM